MMCSGSGTKYRKDDAVTEFESREDGLSYFQEIDDQLCGDCAVDWMERKIRSQPGFYEAYEALGEDVPPWP